MTDATHTRESDLDGRLQRILFDVHRKCKSDTISNIIEYANDEIKAAMRKAYELDRTSTPIPLTPSDEMVEAMSSVMEYAQQWPRNGEASENIGAAIKKFCDELPGWWFSLGYCSVSSDASCGPDVAGPDKELLKIAEFDSGFHVDLLQPSAMSDALMCVMEEAKAARQAALNLMGGK